MKCFQIKLFHKFYVEIVIEHNLYIINFSEIVHVVFYLFYTIKLLPLFIL